MARRKKTNIAPDIKKAPGSLFEILKSKKVHGKPPRPAKGVRAPSLKASKAGAPLFGLLTGAAGVGKSFLSKLTERMGPAGKEAVAPAKKGLGKRFLEALTGRKKTQVEEVVSPYRAPLSPYARGESILLKEFLEHQKEMRLHRGRAHAPKELQDRPTAGGQLAILDQFLQYGEWVPVVSSWIEAARYDLDRLEMSLRFNSGKAVVVESVSWSEAREFIIAPSHGAWTWDHILVRGKGNKGRTQKPVRPL